MTSIQAGKRALYLSANVIMASTTLVKDTGCTGFFHLLLLGVLLPSVLVSGETSSTSATSMPSTSSNAASTSTTPALTAPTAATAITINTQPPTSFTSIAMGTITVTQPSTTVSGSTVTSANTQPSTSTTSGAPTSAAVQSPTMTTSTASTAATTTTTFGVGSTAKTQSSGTMTASGSTSSSSSMTSGSGSSTSMMSASQSSNSTGGMSGMNGTTMTNLTSMSMIYCPSFMCNYSDCYTMYTNQNATSCTAGAYCQLIRQTDMCYTASCSSSCAESCVNASQTNCSVNCCNSTGCLNGSFASMMMTTTTVIESTATRTTTPATTKHANSPQTTVNNGKKCHKGKCTGTTCYTDFGKAPLQTCSSSQPHCQLQKETINSKVQWTAGCTTNCSGQTSCKASTQPPCHLECCNATMTSCLWLNGTLNVPSFATRGPHLNTELLASLLCLLAITLLL